MFHKTRIRLVILNSILFFLILNFFGAGLYLYMQHRLYLQVNETIQNVVKHVEHESLKDIKGQKPELELLDRNLVYLLWDHDGNLVKENPQGFIHATELPAFQKALSGPQSQNIRLGKEPFQVFNLPLPEAGETLQLVYDMHHEQEVLVNLLFVIESGAIISVVIAVLSGLFLANRALIPIQIAWKKQQQFTADASHELRTPLTVLKLHLERLFRHPDHTVEQESEHISVLIQETKRMIQLVNDLLILARSDSNELQLIKGTVRLDEILQTTVNQFRELALLKNIQIETHVNTPLEMLGDEERIHQLIVTLLDNAVKYTEDEGTISIIAAKHANLVQIIVKDTGVGIPEQDIPYIFDRFFRGDKSRSRKEGGSGLGLSIAKWIVDAHDGKIRVESKPGIGTSVILSFHAKK